MNQPPRRDDDTRELIDRFQAARARRRRMRLALAGLGGAVVLAVVVAGVAWAVTSLHDNNSPDVSAASLAVNDAPSSSDPSESSGATATRAGVSITGDPTATDDPTAAGPGPAGSGAQAATASGSTTTLGETDDSTTATASPRLISAARATTTARPTTTSGPTTTVKATTTSSAPPTSAAGSDRKIVVIDPGHQAKGDSNLEPIGPGSSQMKAKVSSGTAGRVTGIPESELNLAVGLKLRDALEASGIKVIMTRTTQDVRISNIERAQVANDAGADLFIRIHADGSDNPSANGIHVLYPASTKGWTDDIATASKKAAQLAQGELIAATGANNRGIDARSDMTGFNWSDVPAIIPEIGFMTNPDEDRLLATDSYRDKIVKGLTRAILGYLGVS